MVLLGLLGLLGGWVCVRTRVSCRVFSAYVGRARLCPGRDLVYDSAQIGVKLPCGSCPRALGRHVAARVDKYARNPGVLCIIRIIV